MAIFIYKIAIIPRHSMRVSPSCILQTYALSSSPPETAMELFTGSIDTENTEADDKDSDWIVLMKFKKITTTKYALKRYMHRRRERYYHCFQCYATFKIKMLKIAMGILYGILVYRNGFTTPRTFRQQQLQIGLNHWYKITAVFAVRIQTYQKVCHRQHFYHECEGTLLWQTMKGTIWLTKPYYQEHIDFEVWAAVKTVLNFFIWSIHYWSASHISACRKVSVFTSVFIIA